MTFKEKLMEEHPEAIDDAYEGGCLGCPGDHEWGKGWRCPRVIARDSSRCRICWNSEMPETETKNIEEEKPVKRSIREVLHNRIAECISREVLEDAIIEAIAERDFSYYVEEALDDAIGNLDEQIGEAARQIADDLVSDMIADILDF